MTLSITLAVFVMILGLILYVVAAPKWQEIGRLAFFAGLLAALLSSGSASMLHVR